VGELLLLFSLPVQQVQQLPISMLLGGALQAFGWENV
jgi:hypothetical protein